MSSRAVLLIVFLAATGVGWLGFTTLKKSYLAPRRLLTSTIETYQTNIALLHKERKNVPLTHAALRGVIDRTFGPDLETVDHRLLSRLNRIGEDIGLSSLSVSKGEEKARLSPATSEFDRRWKALRDELDFIERNAFISGEATYAQALELLARLEAEPWIKRLYFVRLDPLQGGERFRVQVRLTTLFLPGESPSAAPSEAAPPIDRAKLAVLAAANPFVIPQEPVAPAQPVEVADVTPGAPPFPYDKWMMTGIVTGPDGAEVWLLEAASGETKRLAPGETLSQMTFVTASGDAAVFELAGKSIELSVGQSLGEALRQ
jgi:hypothetical protein